MAQVKVYGLKESMKPIQSLMSDVIHTCIVEAFSLPLDKRFQRFMYFDKADFIFPDGERSDKYTIIEISIFEGRSVDAKKNLIHLLFNTFKSRLDIDQEDLEITIFESPMHNWGIRGVPGDELQLSYKVEV
jgi:phenylpyruvate tautomerase PptA (4-oxalocrotonate tautomerase family)